MKKNLVVIVSAAMLLALPLNLLAEKLTFVTTELAPYIHIKDKEIIGTDVEIVREICKRLGIDPKIKLVPWRRALKYVKDGKADAIFTPKKTEERAEFLYYPSEPLNVGRAVIVALKGSGIKVTRMDDLKDHTIGVVREYVYTPEFDSYQGMKKEKCDNDENLLKMLAHQRMSLAIFTDKGNLNFISKQFGTEVEIVYVLNEAPSYVAFSKKSLGKKGKEMAEKFGQILIQLKKEGVFQKIRSRYLD